MFKEKFVVAVKHNGRVMREQGDTILIPFGSEYTLLLKNLNSVRALVRVEIDGQDATEGTSLIVPANGSIDLERFIKGGNFEQGNRFKFIERTKKIEDGPRGIQAEDGLIRVEFEFEQEAAPIKRYYDEWHPRRRLGDYWYSPQYGTGVGIYDTLLRSTTVGSVATAQATYSATSAGTPKASGDTVQLSAADLVNASYTLTSTASDEPMAMSFNAGSDQVQAFASAVNDVGITVPGSVSDQKFTTGSWFPTDGVKHVMVLKLLGQVGEKVVEKPVTVKAKPTCTTCGTVNKANAKFCRECGTALTIA
jgi:hypothetical protein